MYALSIIQQPRTGYISTPSNQTPALLRPTPIVGLSLLFNASPSPPSPSLNLFIYADFYSTSNEEVVGIGTGNAVSSLFRGGKKGESFAVFPGLGCKREGSYKLKMSLYEMREHKVCFWTSVFTDPFQVVQRSEEKQEEVTAVSGYPVPSTSTSRGTSQTRRPSIAEVPTPVTPFSSGTRYQTQAMPPSSHMFSPIVYQDYEYPDASKRRRASEPTPHPPLQMDIDARESKRRRASVPDWFPGHPGVIHEEMRGDRIDYTSTLERMQYPIGNPQYPQYQYPVRSEAFIPSLYDRSTIRRPIPIYPSFNFPVPAPESFDQVPQLQYQYPTPHPVPRLPQLQAQNRTVDSQVRRLQNPHPPVPIIALPLPPPTATSSTVLVEPVHHSPLPDSTPRNVVSNPPQEAGPPRSKSFDRIMGSDTRSVKEGVVDDWFE